MEEKKIALKELDAYIGIAAFYIFDHVTGKNPFEKEDLDEFYQIHERVDFLKNVIRNIIN